MNRLRIWVFNNPVKSVVLGVSLGLLGLVSAAATLATLTVATVESGALTPLGVLPSSSVPVELALEEAQAVREEAFAAFVAQIDADLRQIATSVDVTTFAGDMVNWQSKFKAFTGSDSYREWARTRFIETVFDPVILRQFILLRLSEFHKAQTLIDDQLLLQLEVDVDFNGDTIELPIFDLKSFDSQMESVVVQAEDATWQSVGEFAVSTGVGMVAGDATAKLMSATGPTDEYGNPTVGNQIASFLGGLIVDFATDHFVSTLADTQGRLESSIRATVDANIASLYVGASLQDCWLKPLHQVVEHHHRECQRIITEKLGHEF